ncbi:hypothetical protein [Hydrogenophaga crassostreae]|uniref:hypothetical protein n=1 Tax=Hydrogenophaga crassostreae TaxID=1763535 RepID=UPI000A98D6DD|nr:hypothetical protein [Hydrogenophaga crassostreae]
MDVLKFAFKLLKHGGIFVLRVVGIFVPVFGSALANTRVHEPSESNEWHGIPNLDAIEHPLWDETYGPNRRPW